MGILKKKQEILTTDELTHKYLKKISEQYKTRYVIRRALVNGLFTAIGATIGFAIVIFALSRIIAGLKEVPFVDDILRQTKLDVLIEKELNNISPDSSTPEENDKPIEYLSYKSSELNIEFLYPSTLVNVDEILESAVLKRVELIGEEGNLREIIIYIDQDITLEGNKVTQLINGEDDELEIYEDGGKLNNREVSTPIFVYKTEKNSKKLAFIGYGEQNSPKLSREVFINVIESIK